MQHRLKLCGSRCLASIANVLYLERDFWSAYELVLPSKRHRAVGKETGKTSYRRAVQLYPSTTSVSIGQKNIVIFQKLRQSHWCYLEFYSLLQCFFATGNILSSLALPRHGLISGAYCGERIVLDSGHLVRYGATVPGFGGHELSGLDKHLQRR